MPEHICQQQRSTWPAHIPDAWQHLLPVAATPLSSPTCFALLGVRQVCGLAQPLDDAATFQNSRPGLASGALVT